MTSHENISTSGLRWKTFKTFVLSSFQKLFITKMFKKTQTQTRSTSHNRKETHKRSEKSPVLIFFFDRSLRNKTQHNTLLHNKKLRKYDEKCIIFKTTREIN